MTVRRDLIVVGAGGHAKVVVAALLESGHRVLAAFDDDAARWGETLLGVPIVGPIAASREHVSTGAVIGIGGNAARSRLARELHLAWEIVVHPRAWVHESVVLGRGTVVFAGAIVQPGSTLGEHVIVNTAASIDHDCVLGDFVHVAPGAHLAGSVRVGEGSFLGVGSAAIPGVTVGKGVTVGAGGVVVRDLPDGVTATGVPARPRPTAR